METSKKSSSSSSWARRKSFFALSNIRPSSLDDTNNSNAASRKTLTKKSVKSNDRTLASLSPLSTIAHLDVPTTRFSSDQPSTSISQRPELSMKGAKRPPSVFESFKNSVRPSSDELIPNVGYYGEPLSSTSSKAPSLVFDHAVDGASPPMRAVLLHGEVQTSAGMFRKKKEYLVLTEVHIIRYKSQLKAAETFKTIPHPSGGRSPTVIRHGSGHGSMASIGSQSELQTLSDSSGDKHGRVPLRQVVAVHKIDDGKPYFALEVCYLDEESGQASVMTLQFGNPDERDVWLKRIRDAVNDARLREVTYITPFNLENAARIVERDNDYDPANCAIFKVVQRQVAAKSASRSSAEDLTKVASTVCFLVIGVHKLHLIQLVKPVARTSSPSLASNNSQTSHGILTLSAVKVSSFDDTFELIFRQPLQKPRTLYLASSASYDIAARLHFANNFLRPECGQRLFGWAVPSEVEALLTPPAEPEAEEHNCLDRTLIAYCVAYGVNPANVKYTISYTCEDAPGFELLPPVDSRRSSYGPLELLAIMRALRYNESFGSVSFANVQLDGLNGLHDNYGQEHVCARTKRGTAIKLTTEELNQSSLLVQEVRALAATSKKLRRMDFSGCMNATHTAPDSNQREPSRTTDIGCGIVEALFPLCKHQTTNVDWICLNGIELSDTDQDYLVGAAVDKSCHFRAIELNRCGLSDRSMGLILDALRVQENTLEALEIAGNACRLNPAAFDSQLGMFGFIRKLNLSNVSRTSGAEPFLQAETLLIWRLQELRLSGTALNPATIDAISTYLAHPQSDSLHELYVDHTYLSGTDVATLLHSLCSNRTEVRNMHLDIGQCLLNKGLEQVTQAISNGLTPSHLSMRAIEYREEAMFRKVINALTGNKTIRFLDMSQTALPGDASEETCKALSRLLAENQTLVELDISGDDSRLATSKFGPGLNETLNGLKHNSTLQVFRIEKQKLGVRGASTLAEVLRVNRSLLELHCDNNDIPLQGLTDLVNALIDNTSLVALPPMNDGRAAAFKAAESTMKVMSDSDSSASSASMRLSGNHHTFHGASAMKRGLANVRKGATRTAAASSPSFPALSSYSRSSTSSETRANVPISLTLPATKTKHSSTAPVSTLPSNFTVQDIQTTHRLLTEQWDRQCYRLEQYLNRNWCILNQIPCDMEVEDEKFERPGSVGSIGKMLEQVKYDTTPKAERPAYFESATPDMPGQTTSAGDENEKSQERHSLNFKQFILDSDTSDSDDWGEDVEENVRQLRLDREGLEEPRTPTQQAFRAE